MVVYLYLVDVSNIAHDDQEARHTYVKKELNFLKGQFASFDDVEIVAIPTNESSNLQILVS